MSFEINPVLAGKFDTPDTGTTNNLGAAGDTNDVSGPDPRRYTQFDRTAVDGAGSTTDFSFGDLLDTLNPLEHIPVVSSIYRAIAGETINPVARVAGDILYGGAFGVASAVVGGVGAVADSEFEAQTGKDSGGLAMAMLLGPDDDESKNPVQLADAGTTASKPSGSQKIEITQSAPATPALAALQIPDNASASSTSAVGTSALALNTHTADPPPPQSAPVAQVAEAAASPAAASAPSLTAPPATGATTPPASTVTPTPPAATAPGTIPLLASTGATPGAKQAFGGVMAPPNAQEQDMTMAVAQSASSMRLGHTIFTNRLMNGRHPLPPMLSTSPSNNTATPAPAYAPPPVLPAMPTSFTTSSVTAPASAAYASGGMSAMPPELMQDMMLKALSQYRSVASGPSNMGGTVNLAN